MHLGNQVRGDEQSQCMKKRVIKYQGMFFSLQYRRSISSFSIVRRSDKSMEYFACKTNLLIIDLVVIIKTSWQLKCYMKMSLIFQLHVKKKPLINREAFESYYFIGLIEQTSFAMHYYRFSNKTKS